MGKRDQQQMVTLEAFLAEMMQERALSITALARGVGISTVTIHSYLNGARPSIDNCRKLSFFLGVPLGKIVSLAYPNIEEKRVDSLLEIYLKLSEHDRHVLEDLVFAMQRRMEEK